jgi:hypothetical protein
MIRVLLDLGVGADAQGEAVAACLRVGQHAPERAGSVGLAQVAG